MLTDNTTKQRAGKPPPKKRKIFTWRFVAAFIVLVGLQEFIEYRFGWALWPLIPKLFAGIIAFLAIIGEAIFGYVTDDAKKRISFEWDQDKSFWTSFFTLLQKLTGRYILGNLLVMGSLVVVLTLSVSAYAAHEGFARQTIVWCQKNIIWLITPPSDPSDTSENTENDNIGFKEPTLPTVSQSDIGDKSPLVEVDDRSLAERLILEPDITYLVDNDDRNLIFFLDGAYEIKNWDSEEEILSKVRDFTDDKRATGTDPNFAEIGTPQPVKDEIAWASELERNLEESAELDTIIQKRSNIYSLYPEYRLAKLLRENFCLYGDAYCVQASSNEAALILYEKSILWGFCTLEYDVGTASFSNNLEILSERYEKITQITSKDTFIYRYATALNKAFQTLSAEYSTDAAA